MQRRACQKAAAHTRPFPRLRSLTSGRLQPTPRRPKRRPRLRQRALQPRTRQRPNGSATGAAHARWEAARCTTARRSRRSGHCSRRLQPALPITTATALHSAARAQTYCLPQVLFCGTNLVHSEPLFSHCRLARVHNAIVPPTHMLTCLYIPTQHAHPRVCAQTHNAHIP